MEAVIIVDVLRRAGVDVLLASVEKELEVEGSLGNKIVADAYVSECADEVCDLVALPGRMPGSVRLRDCEILCTITTNQAEEKRFYGAICAAPAVPLKPWGLLKKKEIYIRSQSFENVDNPLWTSFLRFEQLNQIFRYQIYKGRAKVDVVVASAEKSLKIVASQQTKIIADKSIEEPSDSIYDLVVLPGGVKGAERLQKSKILERLLKEQKAAGRMYGGFCSSLAILQKQGLLMDKVTKYHPKVVSGINGPESDEAGVVIDGKTITGRGLGSAIDFSLAVVNKLFGYGRARSLAEGLVFEYGKS